MKGLAGFRGVPDIRANGRFRLVQTRSLACAVVSGRLEGLAAIGEGSRALLAGEAPGGCRDFGVEVAQAGYAFARSLRNGDSIQGDLDAISLGIAVADDNALGLNLNPNTPCTIFDAANLDIAATFSDMPSYQGLDAWDMAESLLDN